MNNCDYGSVILISITVWTLFIWLVGGCNG